MKMLSNSYLCSVSDGGTTYRFNNDTKEFTKLSQTAGIPTSYVYYERHVNCLGKLHVYYGKNVFKIFDETNESWSSKDVVLPYNEFSVMFSLNNKIYYGGGGTYAPYNSFFEIDPSNGYLVRTLSAFPSSALSGNYEPAAYLSFNNKGYVLYSNNIFLKYDPLSGTWTKLANFPASSRTGAICFAIGEYLYFGTGMNYGVYLSDMWRYDPVANTWTQAPSVPIGRTQGAAFSAEGKAYLGYGRKDYTEINDFYEFDPSYISK
jgi:hypothetical protein